MAPTAVDVDTTNGVHTDGKMLEDGSKSATRSKPDHEEYQYLDLIRDIIDNGEHRPDRTGTGTYSIFAPRPMVFSLSKISTTDQQTRIPLLPLLTTKRVFLRAVTAELLWFLSGCTSSLPLSAQGIRIWDGNGSRAFLDSVGLSHRAEGDLGPVYGFQWRHFGAEYEDSQTDYSGQGVDQLAEVVRKLCHTPWDRRIIMSAWNPADLTKMALPPCHMFAQFYVSFEGRKRKRGVQTQSKEANGEANGEVDAEATPPPAKKEKGTLHCQLYQRSCDMGLGIPFNIASYALLTHMLAHVCDLHPGTLTHVMGDAHVYVDHVDALEEQLKREPREFPEIELVASSEERKSGIGNVQGMEGWKVEDFVVKGYKPHGKIEMKMSV